MGDKQDHTSPLLGKDEDDITAAETAITGTEATDPPSRGLGDEQHFFSARSSHAASSRSVRTVSFMDRSAKWPARLADVHREDHMSQLIKVKRASMAQLFASARDVEGADVEDTIVSLDRKQMQMDSEFVQHLTRFYESLGDTIKMKMPAMEIRLEDVSYRVPSLDDGSGAQKIHTIYNSSPLYTIKKFFERLGGKSKNEVGQEKSGKKMVTNVLTNVNLVLKPKKMYLVLGPPVSFTSSRKRRHP